MLKIAFFYRPQWPNASKSCFRNRSGIAVNARAVFLHMKHPRATGAVTLNITVSDDKSYGPGCTTRRSPKQEHDSDGQELNVEEPHHVDNNTWYFIAIKCNVHSTQNTLSTCHIGSNTWLDMRVGA